MIFQVHKPCYPLSSFIDNFVYYKGVSPAHSIDRFLPDGNINLVFDLTDFPKYIYDNNTLQEKQACRNVWFSGIRNNFITIPSSRNSEMFIVNFRKGQAYPFVQVPLNELTDHVVDAELVLTNEILNLREVFLQTSSTLQKFRNAEQYLVRHYAHKLHVNPFIDYAVNKILQLPDALTIAAVAGRTGYSQKHFIKIFRDNVGLTPKTFLKVTRFQKAIKEIEQHKKISWASIAIESGYYDQAHFINDFKNFSGFTPRQYLVLKNEEINYVPVK